VDTCAKASVIIDCRTNAIKSQLKPARMKSFQVTASLLHTDVSADTADTRTEMRKAVPADGSHPFVPF
jgi:hypothetical protein